MHDYNSSDKKDVSLKVSRHARAIQIWLVQTFALPHILYEIINSIKTKKVSKSS